MEGRTFEDWRFLSGVAGTVGESLHSEGSSGELTPTQPCEENVDVRAFEQKFPKSATSASASAFASLPESKTPKRAEASEVRLSGESRDTASSSGDSPAVWQQKRRCVRGHPQSNYSDAQFNPFSDEGTRSKAVCEVLLEKEKERELAESSPPLQRVSQTPQTVSANLSHKAGTWSSDDEVAVTAVALSLSSLSDAPLWFLQRLDTRESSEETPAVREAIRSQLKRRSAESAQESSSPKTPSTTPPSARPLRLARASSLGSEAERKCPLQTKPAARGPVKKDRLGKRRRAEHDGVPEVPSEPSSCVLGAGVGSSPTAATLSPDAEKARQASTPTVSLPSSAKQRGPLPREFRISSLSPQLKRRLAAAEASQHVGSTPGVSEASEVQNETSTNPVTPSERGLAFFRDAQRIASSAAAPDGPEEESAAGADLTDSVIRQLQTLAEVYEQRGDGWRAAGFRRGASVIRSVCATTDAGPDAATASPVGAKRKSLGRSTLLATRAEKAAAALRGGLRVSNVKMLKWLPGIGESLFRTVEEILVRGASSRELVFAKTPEEAESLRELQLIWGVGPKTARRLIGKGFRSVVQLREAWQRCQRDATADGGAGLKAFPLTREQRESLPFCEALALKIPRREVASVEAFVRSRLVASLPRRSDEGDSRQTDAEDSSSAACQSSAACVCCGARLEAGQFWQRAERGVDRIEEVVCCGSFRRGREFCGDIDLLVVRSDDAPAPLLPAVVEELRQEGLLTFDLQLRTRGGLPRSKQQLQGQVHSERRRDRTWLGVADSSSDEGASSAEDEEEAFDDHKDRGDFSHAAECYYGLCVWPPPRKANSERDLSGACRAASQGLTRCPQAEEGCLRCAQSWLGPSVARRIDIKIYPRKMKAFAMLYFTGSAIFNRSMRFHAKKLGFSLDDTGLYAVSRIDSPTKKQRIGPGVNCATEEEVFEALNLKYKIPPEREVPVTEASSS